MISRERNLGISQISRLVSGLAVGGVGGRFLELNKDKNNISSQIIHKSTAQKKILYFLLINFRMPCLCSA